MTGPQNLSVLFSVQSILQNECSGGHFFGEMLFYVNNCFSNHCQLTEIKVQMKEHCRTIYTEKGENQSMEESFQIPQRDKAGLLDDSRRLSMEERWTRVETCPLLKFIICPIISLWHSNLRQKFETNKLERCQRFPHQPLDK